MMAVVPSSLESSPQSGANPINIYSRNSFPSVSLFGALWSAIIRDFTWRGSGSGEVETARKCPMRHDWSHCKGSCGWQSEWLTIYDILMQMPQGAAGRPEHHGKRMLHKWGAALPASGELIFLPNNILQTQHQYLCKETTLCKLSSISGNFKPASF